MWIHVHPNWKTNLNSENGRKISFSDETKASKSFTSEDNVIWCPMMKRKENIMWVYVYPNWKTNFDSKNGRKGSFSYGTKSSKSFITTRRVCLQRLIMKRKGIVMWIHIYLNWKRNFNSRNCRKTSFSFETNASISFIPIRRMCLWCPIMIWKEIVMWTHVYPNWKSIFDSKNGRKWSFPYETKASISFIQTRRMWLLCPIMKRKEIIMWIHIYLNWKANFDSKNGRKRSFSYETEASKSFITRSRMSL